MHTLIVAPNYIAELCGISVIKVGTRKIHCCDAKLKTLFSCYRKHDDDLTVSFLELVRLIALRAAA